MRYATALELEKETKQFEQDIDRFRNAAQQAAQQALQQLQGLKPAFALVLVDLAWEMLLKSHPGVEISAVQEMLGKDVPIAGGYTLGQIVPGKTSNLPQLLNQHILWQQQHTDLQIYLCILLLFASSFFQDLLPP